MPQRCHKDATKPRFRRSERTGIARIFLVLEFLHTREPVSVAHRSASLWTEQKKKREIKTKNKIKETKRKLKEEKQRRELLTVPLIRALVGHRFPRPQPSQPPGQRVLYLQIKRNETRRNNPASTRCPQEFYSVPPFARIHDSHGAKRAHHRIVNFHNVKNVINRRKEGGVLRDQIVSSLSTEWNETNINSSGRPCRPLNTSQGVGSTIHVKLLEILDEEN